MCGDPSKEMQDRAGREPVLRASDEDFPIDPPPMVFPPSKARLLSQIESQWMQDIASSEGCVYECRAKEGGC